MFDDFFYIDLLKLLESQARCIKRPIAAVIVNTQGSILGLGANGAAEGVESCVCTGVCLRSEAKSGYELDNCVSLHAEIAALSDAQKLGLSVVGCAVYCTARPCIHCLKSLIGAGICTIKYIQEYPIEYPKAYNILADQIQLIQL